MVSLRNHLITLGLGEVAAWQLGRATATSHDGKYIVGTGINPNGDSEGWIAFLGSCDGDFDGDDDTDVQDFFIFLDLFAAGDPRADLNGDDVVDINDFFLFMEVLVAGCDAFSDEIKWINPAGGSWHDAANWLPPRVPDGPDDRVRISRSGQYTITIDRDVLVDRLQITNAGARVELRESMLEVGPGGVACSGEIVISGTDVNAGVLSLDAEGHLAGGGEVHLSSVGDAGEVRIRTSGGSRLPLGMRVMGAGTLSGRFNAEASTIVATNFDIPIRISGTLAGGTHYADGGYISLNGLDLLPYTSIISVNGGRIANNGSLTVAVEHPGAPGRGEIRTDVFENNGGITIGSETAEFAFNATVVGGHVGVGNDASFGGSGDFIRGGVSAGGGEYPQVAKLLRTSGSAACSSDTLSFSGALADAPDQWINISGWLYSGTSFTADPGNISLRGDFAGCSIAARNGGLVTLGGEFNSCSLNASEGGRAEVAGTCTFDGSINGPLDIRPGVHFVAFYTSLSGPVAVGAGATVEVLGALGPQAQILMEPQTRIQGRYGGALGRFSSIAGEPTIYSLEPDLPFEYLGTLAPGLPVGPIHLRGVHVFHPSARLEIELAGAAPGEFDGLLGESGNSAITLAGSLVVALADDFLPVLGDRFAIIEADAITGRFETLELPALPSGALRVEYTDSSVELVVVGCDADINGDGDADADDFFAYLDLFAAGDPAADLDGDGDIDVDDFMLYLDLFAAGGCE